MLPHCPLMSGVREGGGENVCEWMCAYVRSCKAKAMRCISRLLGTTYPKVVVREECFLCSCCCIDLFCISQEQLSTKRTYEEEEEEEEEKEDEEEEEREDEEEEREREGGGENQRSLDIEVQIKRWH